MDTVLLIEDDRYTRHFIREQLENHNILILEAVSGKRSLEILRQHPIDVILMDIGLPDGSGLDYIPRIREHSDVPLIIISGDDDEVNRITGLERGADDFMAKPVSPGELLARIHANLRRYRKSQDEIRSPEGILVKSGNICFGEWILDCDQFQLFHTDGQSAGLTAHEFKILKALIGHADQVLPRDDLSRLVTDDCYIPTPRAIDVQITRIRKKIFDNADDPQIIKTVRGVGYMFSKDMLCVDRNTPHDKHGHLRVIHNNN